MSTCSAGSVAAREAAAQLLGQFSSSTLGIDPAEQRSQCGLNGIWQCFPQALAALMADRDAFFCEVSLRIANVDNVLRRMAHLYQLTRSMGLVQPWEDLDNVILRHEGLPKEQVSSVRVATGRYCNAMGAVSSRVSPSFKGAQLLTSGSALVNAKRKRDLSDADLGFQRGDPLEATLEALAEVSEAQKCEQSKRSSKHTLAQLLHTYLDARIHDEHTSNFDYLSMWMDCTRIFQVMALFKGFAAGVEGNRETFMQIMPIESYFFADGDEREQRDFSSSDDPLHQAAKVLACHIKKNGSKYTSEVNTITKGLDLKQVRDPMTAPASVNESDLN